MHSLITDLRFGARMLWKSKGVTFVALVSLAIGIGANAAIFSLANAVLLRPRPVANPGELIEVYAGERTDPYSTTSYPSYVDLRAQGELFSGLAAYGYEQYRLGSAGEVEPVWGELVSGNYFDVLGVPAHRGRMFLPEEDEVPGRNPVVVIGYALWERRFGSDPGLVGRTISVNHQRLTVVGVAPPEYRGMMRGLSIDLWIPVMVQPMLDPQRGERILTSRGNRWLTLVGRLTPGVTLTQARAQLDLLSGQFQAEHPEEWRSMERGHLRELFLSALPESATRIHPKTRAPVYALVALLFVIVDLVLVIACINLASTFFARAVARRGEIAVRLALGAGRTRIIRQLLTESLLLALVAGGAGILLAQWGLSALMASLPALPEGIRVAVDVQLDWRVVTYTVAFATVTGLLFGLAPALHSSRASIAAVLQGDTAAVTERQRRSRVRTTLIVAQVALSQLLLIGAGLVWRSLENVRPTRLGFATERILVTPLTLDEGAYDPARSQLFFERLSERVARLPGVRSTSYVEGMPGGFMSRSRRGVRILGAGSSLVDRMEIDATMTGPRYFTNMGVPFVQGRDFTARDRAGAPCVAIVNEVFANRFLSDAASPIGRRLSLEAARSGDRDQGCEVVGVIRDDEWQSLVNEVRPFFAMALLQSDERSTTMLVETDGDPALLAPAVRRIIQELDATVPLVDIQTLAQYFEVTSYPFRILGLVIGACGLMAFLLATVGIYGIVSYSVAQRRREVGIRVALGAVQGDILRLIVGQVMRLVGYGLVLGLLLGGALTRVLTSGVLEGGLLFGVGARDALTVAGVTILLAAVAFVACGLPALRAARADPMTTLRNA